MGTRSWIGILILVRVWVNDGLGSSFYKEWYARDNYYTSVFDPAKIVLWVGMCVSGFAFGGLRFDGINWRFLQNFVWRYMTF
jgi:hypothetical protein